MNRPETDGDSITEVLPKRRMDIYPDRFDVCECGDYRHQHFAGGRCIFNKPGNIGHGGAPDCFEFRLSLAGEGQS